jgi:hypothetical protein
MATMTPKSTYTAKGSIAAATGASTPANLSVGNNGETLVADSSTSTGLRYQVPKTNNVIVNGNLDWWQRGTSFTSVASTYTADRWTCSNVGTGVSLTVTQDTSVPNPNSKYSIKYQQVTTSASAITEYCGRQFIEQSNILPLLGKTCVLSFWYKSNKTGSHGVRIYGSYNTGGADQITTFTVSVADTWEYKTVSVTAFAAVSAPSATATSSGAIVDLGFRVNTAGFTTLSANDYFQFDQVQLEVGSVATPFARAGGTIQGELSAAQRYYYRSTSSAGSQTAIGITGITNSTTNLVGYFNPPVPMRVTPTAVEFSSIGTQTTGSGLTAISAVAIVNESTNSSVSMNMTSSGFTANLFGLVRGTTGTGYIGLSAEL